MRKENVIAILCSDLHLSAIAPTARKGGDWYEAQAKVLLRLKQLQRVYGDCPIIIAGDIFNHWNSPAELINFAILEMPPNVYMIPGQHDCPYHRYEDIHKSAYWTLVAAGAVTHIDKPMKVTGVPLTLYPFPWGKPLVPNTIAGILPVRLAVIHAYVWRDDSNGYPGAPEERKLVNVKASLKGYEAAVFGDNHKSFIDPTRRIFNGGTMMRRNSDEKGYEPQVGLLHSDGIIVPWKLDIDEVITIPDDQVERVYEALEMAGFLEELVSLGQSLMDFHAAMEHALEMNTIDRAVKDIIIAVMERNRGRKNLHKNEGKPREAKRPPSKAIRSSRASRKAT